MTSAREGRAARLLATGFGPFPGAPENPTAALMRALAGMAAETFCASAFQAVALPTEYRRSWEMLERLYDDFAPDIVVHFGLSDGIEAIHLECVGRNAVDRAKPDAAGHAPPSTLVAEHGAETLPSTFPAKAIFRALLDAGIPAALSDDAGDYVCNATLYRSLRAAPATRRVGFVHVPPEGRNGFVRPRLIEAATVVLKAAAG